MRPNKHTREMIPVIREPGLAWAAQPRKPHSRTFFNNVLNRKYTVHLRLDWEMHVGLIFRISIEVGGGG